MHNTTTKLGAGVVQAVPEDAENLAAADAGALEKLDEKPVALPATPTDGTLVLSGGSTRMRTAYLNIAYSVCKWFKQDSMHDGGLALEREVE